MVSYKEGEKIHPHTPSYEIEVEIYCGGRIHLNVTDWLHVFAAGVQFICALYSPFHMVLKGPPPCET